MALPCHHLLFIRMHLGITLYDESLVHKRWTLSFYKSCFNVRFSNESQGEVESSAVADICTIVDRKDNVKETVLTQGQKLKKMTSIAQKVISVGCEGGMRVFNARYRQLEDLLTQWRNKDDIRALEDLPGILLNDDTHGKDDISINACMINEDNDSTY